MHPYVHCSIMYSSRELETAQVPISTYVDKKAVVRLHSGILLSDKKEKQGEEMLPFVTAWMDLEIITLRK